MRVTVLVYSFLLKEGSTGRGARALQRQEQPDASLFPVGEAREGVGVKRWGLHLGLLDFPKRLRSWKTFRLTSA